MESENKQWWVIDRDEDNLKLRGPYQHEETADAVRTELENRTAYAESTLWVVSLPQTAIEL